MRKWTGVEILDERGRMEREAATTLGFVLFEYNRLDMELGWFLSWKDEGKSLDESAKKNDGLKFSERLKHLRKAVEAKFGDSPIVLESYASWLADANAIRELRNQFFHGRWSVLPVQQVVVNTVGLPNLPEQTSNFYALDELETALRAVRDLRTRLQELRESHPV